MQKDKTNLFSNTDRPHVYVPVYFSMKCKVVMGSSSSANEERPLIPHSSININGYQTFQETRVLTISRVTLWLYTCYVFHWHALCLMGKIPKCFPTWERAQHTLAPRGHQRSTESWTLSTSVARTEAADRRSAHSIATAIATIQSAFSSNIFLQLPQEKEQKRQWGGSRRLLVIVCYQTGATVGRRICGCDKTEVGAPSEEKSKLFLAAGNPPVTQKGRRLEMLVCTSCSTGESQWAWNGQFINKACWKQKYSNIGVIIGGGQCRRQSSKQHPPNRLAFWHNAKQKTNKQTSHD